MRANEDEQNYIDPENDQAEDPAMYDDLGRLDSIGPEDYDDIESAHESALSKTTKGTNKPSNKKRRR